MGLPFIVVSCSITLLVTLPIAASQQEKEKGAEIQRSGMFQDCIFVFKMAQKLPSALN